MHDIRSLLIFTLFCIAVVAPRTALAQTGVLVLSGTGELKQWNTSASVEQAVPLTFEWWTAPAGANGGRWEIEVSGSLTPIATGLLTGSPSQLQPQTFTLPANTFLAPNATATPVTFNVYVRARYGNLLGPQSQPAVVTEVVAGNANLSAIPFDINPISKLPPAPAPEPGHPVAKLISYNPMPIRSEFRVVLEFSNLGSSPTSPVTVTVADLNQVLRQTDTDVVVPSLIPGQRFRVAIALGLQLIKGDSDQSLAQRYDHGISLLVGTAKILGVGKAQTVSPYVQYQQPPIRSAPTATCAGEGCGTASPPYIANFRANDLSNPDPVNDLRTIDLGIAAGQDFLYTSDDIRLKVFRKWARTRYDLTNTEIDNASAAAAHSTANDGGGGFATVFQNFWFSQGPLNLNRTLLKPDAPIPCDFQHPWTSKFCLSQVYDSRISYDSERGRFWLESHATDFPGVTATSECASFPQDNCAAIGEEYHHRVFLAASNSEDPKEGFEAFATNANENVDWEMFAIQGRYGMTFYHDPWAPLPWSFRVFDADSLPSLAQFQPNFTTAAFGNGMIRVPKQHNIKHDIAFMTSTTGQTIQVYAFNSAKGTPPLLGPASYTDPDGKSFYMPGYGDGYQAAMRGDYLYTTTTDGHRIHVWRIPVYLATNNAVVIDANHVGRWTIADSNYNFDYPTIDVTRNGDIVVSFRAWKAGGANQVWLDVLYSGENQFRHSLVLSAPTGAGLSSGGVIDFVSSSVDPADDETVWIIGADGLGPIIASVRP